MCAGAQREHQPEHQPNRAGGNLRRDRQAARGDAPRDIVRGLDRLDSWSTDGHKLLNVAYDCGIAICRHSAAHRAAMSVQASYLEQGTGAVQDEQHPPARSQAVRERSERLDKFSLPCWAFRRSSLPGFHILIWKRFHFGASKAPLCQAQ